MLHQGFSYNSLHTLFNSFHIFLIRATKNVFDFYNFQFLRDYLHCKNLHLLTFHFYIWVHVSCTDFMWHFKPKISKRSNVIIILTIIFGHHLYFVRTSTKGFCSTMYHWTPSPMGFDIISHYTPHNFYAEKLLPYETP